MSRPPRPARQLVAFILISILAISGLLLVALAVLFVIGINNWGSNK